MRPSFVRTGLGSRKGSLLLEVMLGIMVFSIFLAAVSTTLLRGQEDTTSGGNRARAVYLTEQALEGMRNVRNDSFPTQNGGPYGVKIGSDGFWHLSGSGTTSSGGYVTRVTLTQLSSDWVRVRAETKWKIGYGRSGSVVLTTDLTDWREADASGDWTGIALERTYTATGTPNFRDIALAGNYAYVSAEAGGSVPGLYIFNLSSSSTRPSLAAQFSLGSGIRGYQLRTHGKTLYIVTSDSAAELKAYDITSPTSPVLLASYDIPGSGRARALAIYGQYLYVGADSTWTAMLQKIPLMHLSFPSILRADVAIAQSDSSDDSESSAGATCGGTGSGCLEDAECCSGYACVAVHCASTTGTPSASDDFFAFKIPLPDQIQYLDSLVAGGVNAISVSGTSAYLASPGNATELTVINVANPSNVSIAGTFNLSDRTQDAYAVDATDTDVLLGTDRATAIQEMVLYSLQNGSVPPASPAPLYHESSGSIVAIDADPARCYGFLGVSWAGKSVQVVNLRNTSLPEYTSYSTTPYRARAVRYDAKNDRLYLLTSTHVHSLRPQSASGTCF